MGKFQIACRCGASGGSFTESKPAHMSESAGTHADCSVCKRAYAAEGKQSPLLFNCTHTCCVSCFDILWNKVKEANSNDSSELPDQDSDQTPILPTTAACPICAEHSPVIFTDTAVTLPRPQFLVEHLDWVRAAAQICGNDPAALQTQLDGCIEAGDYERAQQIKIKLIQRELSGISDLQELRVRAQAAGRAGQLDEARLCNQRAALLETGDDAQKDSGDKHRLCLRHDAVAKWVLFLFTDNGHRRVQLMCDTCMDIFEAADPDADAVVLSFDQACSQQLQMLQAARERVQLSSTAARTTKTAVSEAVSRMDTEHIQAREDINTQFEKLQKDLEQRKLQMLEDLDSHVLSRRSGLMGDYLQLVQAVSQSDVCCNSVESVFRAPAASMLHHSSTAMVLLESAAASPSRGLRDDGSISLQFPELDNALAGFGAVGGPSPPELLCVESCKQPGEVHITWDSPSALAALYVTERAVVAAALHYRGALHQYQPVATSSEAQYRGDMDGICGCTASYRVRSGTADGIFGCWSSAVQIKAPIFGPPSMPMSVRVAHVADTSLSVVWEQPNRDETKPTEYSIWIRRESKDAETAFKLHRTITMSQAMNEVMTSTDKVMPRLTARGYQTPRVESMSGGVERLTTTVTGLRPNTKYQFKVQATNSNGVGPLSPATLLSGTQERHVGQFSCRFCGQ